MTPRPGPHHFDMGAEWRAFPHFRSMFRPHRMRRGDIRSALLLALAEGAAHGYELMHRLEEKSGGSWRPSPGSIYPTLQMLEDEGLVTSVEKDGKRVYDLTPEGRAEADARATQRDDPFWFANRGRYEEIAPLRRAFMDLGAAVWQVAQAGKSEQIARAAELVEDARKKVYQMLAE